MGVTDLDKLESLLETNKKVISSAIEQSIANTTEMIGFLNQFEEKTQHL